MRRTAWVLLVLFVFSIPWEYSLDLGAPYGNIARMLGLATALMAMMAALQADRFRKLAPIHWLVIAMYLWFCCTFFWTATPSQTLAHLRGNAQEMMIVWLVWEFARTSEELRILLRAWLAGSCVLAVLTIAGFFFSIASGAEEVRFVAAGQDPNDAARFLVLGFPVAASLLERAEPKIWRALWLLYFPLGFAAVLLTASRSGLLLAAIALAGCGIGAARQHRRLAIVIGAVLVSTVIFIYGAAPRGTFERLSTTAELWKAGDLNQRVNIWSAGWRAFETAPITGHGAGSFVTAAELGPEDTAHNTAISIMVESGLWGLALAVAIVLLAVREIRRTRSPLRSGLAMLMLVWAVSSLTGTVWENRTTWLLIGIATAGGRVSESSCGESEAALESGDWVLNEHA